MSDAVYECALVGRELRDFEKRTKLHVEHAVLLDGKAQWTSRKSDLLRFYNLYHQGLIDALIVGREVETAWQPFVKSVIEKHGPAPKSLHVAKTPKVTLRELDIDHGTYPFVTSSSAGAGGACTGTGVPPT